MVYFNSIDYWQNLFLKFRIFKIAIVYNGCCRTIYTYVYMIMLETMEHAIFRIDEFDRFWALAIQSIYLYVFPSSLVISLVNLSF